MKRLIKNLISACGYELRRTPPPYGSDALGVIQQCYRNGAPKVIFDVGAHQGETAALYAATFPGATIHSFEPTPRSFAALQANVSGFKNVRAVNVAVGEADGTATLHINQFSQTNSLLPNANEIKGPDSEFMRRVEEVQVPVRSLDSYAHKEGIKFIDLLKIDAQGFELKILGGCRQLLENQQIGFVFTEVLFEPLYQGQAFFHQVYGELFAAGFQLVDLFGQVHSAEHTLRWADGLWMHPGALKEHL